MDGADIEGRSTGTFAVSYTMQQLKKIEIDPTSKVVLFYNMACCYQRHQMYDQCADYLEKSCKCLKERIKLLDEQE
jgi:hypothetical protein|tara:strand:- start:2947 stop:3174 length:228 start_codon:yes stop_codon:yes gene_type:complete